MQTSIILNVGPSPRLKLLKTYLPQTLTRTGSEYELLICDNGSNNRELTEFIESLKPSYFRHNSDNLGNYQMLNQLLLRTTGDYIAYIAGDIEYPKLWLKKLVDSAQKIPNTGMAGFYCVGNDRGVPEVVNGVSIMRLRGAVFGGGLWPRSLHERIGYFYEGYGKYGFGDSDWGLRIAQTELLMYYLDGDTSTHHGDDTDSDNAYRQMKWEMLHQALPRFGERRQQILAGEIYVSPPTVSHGDVITKQERLQMKNLDWNTWRANYNKKQHLEQVEFYRLVAERFPNQKRYDAAFMLDNITNRRGTTVVEIGGWDGALADEVLADKPNITSWLNYELSPQMVANPVCKDARYSATTGDDFAWNCAPKAKVLVLSHSLEHMLEHEFLSLVERVQPQRIVLDAPLTEAQPRAYQDYVGTHIYDGTWETLTAALLERGYKPKLEDGDRRVFLLKK